MKIERDREREREKNRKVIDYQVKPKNNSKTTRTRCNNGINLY